MSSAGAERWVVNASLVILLAKAGVIHLLPQLCAELVVPAGVKDEVRSGRMADAGWAWLDTAAWLRRPPEAGPPAARAGAVINGSKSSLERRL